MNSLPLTARDPFFGVTTTQPCWKCKRPQRVIALGCLWLTDEEEPREKPQEFPSFVLLSSVQEMPEAVLDALRALQPSCEKRGSQTARSQYYMNVCADCGAHFGDWFLFSEPGQGFWPTDAGGFDKITIHRLPVKGEYRLNAAYSLTGNYWLWERCRVLDPEGRSDDELKAQVTSAQNAAAKGLETRMKAERVTGRKSRKRS